MIYRAIIKWFCITLVVLLIGAIVLLFLGYLLKENETTTTNLKERLEQEAYQQQEKANRQLAQTVNKTSTLSAFEKSQQQIIFDHLDCQSDKQCFLVHTNSESIGCLAAVNTLGTTILLKIAPTNENKTLSSNRCEQEYAKQDKLFAQCQDNRCAITY